MEFKKFVYLFIFGILFFSTLVSSNSVSPEGNGEYFDVGLKIFPEKSVNVGDEFIVILNVKRVGGTEIVRDVFIDYIIWNEKMTEKIYEFRETAALHHTLTKTHKLTLQENVDEGFYYVEVSVSENNFFGSSRLMIYVEKMGDYELNFILWIFILMFLIFLIFLILFYNVHKKFHPS